MSLRIQPAEPVKDAISQIKRDRAIERIETDSFQPKSFKSSATSKNPSKTSYNTVEKVDVDFKFGTAAEKKVDQDEQGKQESYFEQRIKAEGLCHPNLFEDPVVREKRWNDYLFNLRQDILSSAV